MRTEPAEENLLDLHRQVCFALAVASRTVVAVYRPLLEPMNLTHPQYLAMLALWQYAPLTVGELGQLLQLEPATVSPLLKRLEANGYVRRRRDPGNERLVRLTLTEEGEALRERALDIPPTVMAKLELTLAEVSELHASLSGLIERARTAVGDRPGAQSATKSERE